MRDHRHDLIRLDARVEILLDSVFEVFGLPHVDDRPLGVFHDIDARISRQHLQFFGYDLRHTFIIALKGKFYKRFSVQQSANRLRPAPQEIKQAQRLRLQSAKLYGSIPHNAFSITFSESRRILSAFFIGAAVV